MNFNRFVVTSYVYTGPQPGFIKPEEAYQDYMLLAIEAGSYTYSIGKHQGNASFGDLVFTPPGTLFKRKALEDVTFHLLSFTQAPDADDITDILPIGKLSLSDINRLSSTYSYLRNAYQSSITPFNKQGIFSHMLMDLLYMCRDEEMLALSHKQMIDPLMQQAARYIHQRLLDSISLQELADKLSIKPSELTRRYKLAYGSTPIEYITKLRLEAVKRLLLKTTNTLEDIASKCGYDNGAYLSRIFRSKTGITPSEFRRRFQF